MPGEKESPKWWVDQKAAPPRESQRGSPLPAALARFYVTTRGFEQEKARAGLTDLNWKLLADANPAEGEFAYVNLIGDRSPNEWLDKVKRALPLPRGGRAVIVDAGKMMRVIVTGTPVGERVLEFNFNRGEPSFDAWVRHEWREEIVFRSLNELYRNARRLIDRYFGPGAVAENEFLT